MKFFSLCYFLLFSLAAFSQSNKFPADRNVFENLKKFLKDQEQLDSVTFMQVEGLTNDYLYPFKNKNEHLFNGIYKLRSGVSHHPAYIVVKKGREVRILSDYSMNILVKEYEEMNKLLKLDCRFKTKCLENIIYIYNDRVDMANNSR